MSDRTLYIEIQVDEKGAVQKLGAVDQAAARIDSSARRGAAGLTEMERAIQRGSAAGSFFGTMAADMARGALSAVRDATLGAVNAAAQYQAQMTGLTTVATAYKQDVDATKRAAQELASDGLMTIGEAAMGLKNLLGSGFGLPEAIQLMKGFKDIAAFNRQASLDFGYAVVSATEGIKNQNSILVDNAGLTKNLSVIMKEAGLAQADMARISSDAGVRQKFLAGLLKETGFAAGDAAKMASQYSGRLSALKTQVSLLWVEMGQYLMPVAEKVVWIMGQIVEVIRIAPGLFVGLGTAIGIASAALLVYENRARLAAIANTVGLIPALKDLQKWFGLLRTAAVGTAIADVATDLVKVKPAAEGAGKALKFAAGEQLGFAFGMVQARNATGQFLPRLHQAEQQLLPLSGSLEQTSAKAVTFGSRLRTAGTFVTSFLARFGPWGAIAAAVVGTLTLMAEVTGSWGGALKSLLNPFGATLSVLEHFDKKLNLTGGVITDLVRIIRSLFVIGLNQLSDALSRAVAAVRSFWADVVALTKVSWMLVKDVVVEMIDWIGSLLPQGVKQGLGVTIALLSALPGIGKQLRKELGDAADALDRVANAGPKFKEKGKDIQLGFDIARASVGQLQSALTEMRQDGRATSENMAGIAKAAYDLRRAGKELTPELRLLADHYQRTATVAGQVIDANYRYRSELQKAGPELRAAIQAMDATGKSTKDLATDFKISEETVKRYKTELEKASKATEKHKDAVQAYLGIDDKLRDSMRALNDALVAARGNQELYDAVLERGKQPLREYLQLTDAQQRALAKYAEIAPAAARLITREFSAAFEGALEQARETTRQIESMASGIRAKLAVDYADDALEGDRKVRDMRRELNDQMEADAIELYEMLVVSKMREVDQAIYQEHRRVAEIVKAAELEKQARLDVIAEEKRIARDRANQARQELLQAIRDIQTKRDLELTALEARYQAALRWGTLEEQREAARQRTLARMSAAIQDEMLMKVYDRHDKEVTAMETARLKQIGLEEAHVREMNAQRDRMTAHQISASRLVEQEIRRSYDRMRAFARQAVEGIVEGFLSGIDQMISGAQSFGDVMRGIWDNLRRSFFQLVSDMVREWVAGLFQMRTAGSATGGVGGFVQNLLGFGAKAVTPAATGALATAGVGVNPAVIGGAGSLAMQNGLLLPTAGAGGAAGGAATGTAASSALTTGAMGTVLGIGAAGGAGILGGFLGKSIMGGAGLGAATIGAGSGAGMGALVGTMLFPGIGTAVGALVGAVGGFISGLFGDSAQEKARKEVFKQLGDGDHKVGEQVFRKEAAALGFDTTRFDRAGDKKEVEAEVLKFDLVKQFGGLDKLRTAADAAGVSLTKLFDARKPEQVRQEIERLNTALERHKTKLEAIAGFTEGAKKRVDAFFKSFEDGLGMSADELKKMKEELALEQAAPEFDEHGNREYGVREREMMEAIAKAESAFLNKLGGTRADVEREFQMMGLYAGTAFAENLREHGIGRALAEAGPMFDQLHQLTDRFGFQLTGAAAKFQELYQAAKGNEDVMASLEGLTGMVKAHGDAIGKNQELFTAFTQDAATQYTRLTERGVAHNNAMILMQPTLQALWEAQRRYGYEADATTQKLIDQAVEQGIVGESQRSVHERILSVLLGIADAFGVKLPKSLREFGDAGEREARRVRTAVEQIPTDREVRVRYSSEGSLAAPDLRDQQFIDRNNNGRDDRDEGYYPETPDYAARGGIVTRTQIVPVRYFAAGGIVPPPAPAVDAVPVRYFAAGGIVPPPAPAVDAVRVPVHYLATGGSVPRTPITSGHVVHFEPRGVDTVPAMLTPGEVVLTLDDQKRLLALLKQTPALELDVNARALLQVLDTLKLMSAEAATTVATLNTIKVPAIPKANPADPVLTTPVRPAPPPAPGETVTRFPIPVPAQPNTPVRMPVIRPPEWQWSEPSLDIIKSPPPSDAPTFVFPPPPAALSPIPDINQWSPREVLDEVERISKDPDVQRWLEEINQVMAQRPPSDFDGWMQRHHELNPYDPTASHIPVSGFAAGGVVRSVVRPQYFARGGAVRSERVQMTTRDRDHHSTTREVHVQRFERGGIVRTHERETVRAPHYLAAGGTVVRFTPRGTDTVPAMLTPGELVLTSAQQREVATAVQTIQQRLTPAAMMPAAVPSRAFESRERPIADAVRTTRQDGLRLVLPFRASESYGSEVGSRSVADAAAQAAPSHLMHASGSITKTEPFRAPERDLPPARELQATGTDGPSGGRAEQTMTIIFEENGRQRARQLVRFIPGATKRYGFKPR